MAERVECLYRVSTTKQVDHDDQNQADIPVQRKACRKFVDTGQTSIPLGAPIEAQRSGFDGERRSDGAGELFADRRKRASGVCDDDGGEAP